MKFKEYPQWIDLVLYERFVCGMWVLYNDAPNIRLVDLIAEKRLRLPKNGGRVEIARTIQSLFRFIHSVLSFLFFGARRIFIKEQSQKSANNI